MPFAFEKRPNEVIVGIGIDFVNRLYPGESISSFTVACADLPTLVHNSWVDGTRVIATLVGGEANVTYDVVYQCTGNLTPDPSILEEVIELTVEE